MIATGSAGINGDAMNGINRLFWAASVAKGTPLVLEPESIGMENDDGDNG